MNYRQPPRQWMIADHIRSLRRVGKIEMFPIFPICRRPSWTVGYLWFRVFISRKIWHCWETVKLPTVLDFPYIWKPGIVTEVAGTAINDRRGDRTVLIFLYCFLFSFRLPAKSKGFLKMFFSFLSAQEKGLRLSSSFKCLNSKVKQKKHCAFNKI